MKWCIIKHVAYNPVSKWYNLCLSDNMAENPVLCASMNMNVCNLGLKCLSRVFHIAMS